MTATPFLAGLISLPKSVKGGNFVKGFITGTSPFPTSIGIRASVAFATSSLIFKSSGAFSDTYMLSE